jgi:hypothetical protein
MQVLGLTALGLSFSDSGGWRAPLSLDSTSVNRGDPTTVAWGIVPDGTRIAFLQFYYPGATSTLRADFEGRFGPSYTNMFAFIFERISSVSGLKLVSSPDDGALLSQDTPPVAGVRGEIRICGYDVTPLPLGYTGGGWANCPGQGVASGILLNTGLAWPSYDDWLKMAMHEAGHTIGFGHQGIFSNAVTQTIYLGPDVGTGAMSGGYGSITGFINGAGPQFDDVYAMHRMYGDRWERDGGNDTPATAETLGVLTNGTARSFGTGVNGLSIPADETDFRSIDGTTDRDCFRVRLDCQGRLAVRLTPVGPTYDYQPEGGTRVTFNASAQSDLWFEVLDATGHQILLKDGAGLGSMEEGDVALGVGEYIVRVGGKQDANQLYRLDLVAQPLPDGLPFIETFEDTPTNMAHVVGLLHGQHGWTSEPAESAVVQVNHVYAGQKALSLSEGGASHSLSGLGATNVWFDFFLQPQMNPDESPFALEQNCSVALYLNSAGKIVVQSGSQWQTCEGFAAASNEWIRLSVRLDYASRKWDLYAARAMQGSRSVRVARALDFVTGSAHAESSAFSVTAEGCVPTHFDNLSVTDEAMAGRPPHLLGTLFKFMREQP